MPPAAWRLTHLVMPPAAILFCSCRKVWRKDTPKGAVPPLGIPPCGGGGNLAFPRNHYGGNLYAKPTRPLPLHGAAVGGGGTGISAHCGHRLHRFRRRCLVLRADRPHGDCFALGNCMMPQALLRPLGRDHWARRKDGPCFAVYGNASPFDFCREYPYKEQHSIRYCLIPNVQQSRRRRPRRPTKAAPARKRNARTKTQRVSDKDAKTAATASMTSGRAGDSQGGASYKRPLGVSFLHTFLHEQKSMAAGGRTS